MAKQEQELSSVQSRPHWLSALWQGCISNSAHYQSNAPKYSRNQIHKLVYCPVSGSYLHIYLKFQHKNHYFNIITYTKNQKLQQSHHPKKKSTGKIQQMINKEGNKNKTFRIHFGHLLHCIRNFEKPLFGTIEFAPNFLYFVLGNLIICSFHLIFYLF